MALCDCYVSLHRSEGYGLTMAEAMAAAKAGHRDGLLGNMAFMHEGNSLLVPYRLTPIPAGLRSVSARCRVGRAGPRRGNPTHALSVGEPRRGPAARPPGHRRTSSAVIRPAHRRVHRPAARRDSRRAEYEGVGYAPCTASGRAAARPGGSVPDPPRAPDARIALLWPYFVEQQTFDTAVAEALRPRHVRIGDRASAGRDTFPVSGHRPSCRVRARRSQSRRDAARAIEPRRYGVANARIRKAAICCRGTNSVGAVAAGAGRAAAAW